MVVVSIEPSTNSIWSWPKRQGKSSLNYTNYLGFHFSQKKFVFQGHMLSQRRYKLLIFKK
jgi:hypothetical protein